MNAIQFQAEFKHIASAKNGLQSLREMIYNLAVTGDLTQQLAEDGNAESLLGEIRSEKARLMNAKTFKHSPKLENQPMLLSSNIKLPDSWSWCRLVDIGEINPRNDAEDNTPASFLPMNGVPELHLRMLETQKRTWGQIRKGFTHFADGDVVLAKITPCFENGKAAVITGLINGIGAGTTELHVVRPIRNFIETAYIYIFLRSPYFVLEGEKRMTGTAGQKRLPTEYFATRAFPLPPRSEQKRIIAKVNELMSLCDKLESQQQERKVLCKITRTAVFQRLAHTKTPTELRTAWHQVKTYTNLLLDLPESIQDYRDLILDFAATGRLSEPQDNDSPVEEMLEAASKSRTSLIANGLIKDKQTPPTEIKEVSIPVPNHWAKSPIMDLFQFIDYRGNTPAKTNSGKVLITAKNVRSGRIDPNPTEFISDAGYHEWMTRGFPKSGDLLITTEAPLGNVAQIEEEPHFALAQRVIDLQPYTKMYTKYFMFFMMSPYFQQLLWINATGITAKGIKAAKLKRLSLSVPPYEEQGRIVQSLEKLLEYCGQLEIDLSKAQLFAGQIAVAFIEAITGIRIEEKEKMKPPKTELVSTLRVGTSPTTNDQAPLTIILIKNSNVLSAKALWNISGLEIDDFYQQLKIEMAKGWIVQPEIAYMKEVESS